MWEDLVLKESKGSLRPEDLVWRPDYLVEMPAYVHSLAARAAIRSRAGTDFLRLQASENPGALLLQHWPKADTSTRESNEKQPKSEYCWISPYCPSLLRDMDRSAADEFLIDDFVVEVLGSTSLKSDPYREKKATPLVDGFAWDHLWAGPATQIALILLSADRKMRAGHRFPTTSIAVRTDLLTESAKLRGLRVALDHLADLYGDPHWDGVLFGVTSAVTMSRFDAENNMIRSTLSGVGAMVGGADWIAIQPWNVFTEGYQDSEAAELSLGLYHLLCDESQLDKLADPMAGSYAVEQLTDRLVRAGWKLFNELRTLKADEIARRLDQEILPRDRHVFEQSGRHVKGKNERAIVGETHYTDTSAGNNVSPRTCVFPETDRPGFSPRVLGGPSQ